MSTHIIEEAKRCLQCKKPQCSNGCPVNTSVNEMIKLLLDKKVLEAGEMLFTNNPLSVICALICPHELQCEGHCVLSKKGAPVHISSIEHYISDYYLNTINIKPIADPNKKVGIIGSGPAGITVAVILALKGFDITLFESRDRIGGVMRYGIPEFRLPKSILERMKEMLVSIGIKIRPNTSIGLTLTIDDLFQDGYKAIFIGTGVWKPRKLGIRGESFGHVHYAIDYLKNPDVYNLGETVCIIGAGNVAMDVARTALRKSSRKVVVIYRKGPEEMTALKEEIEYAKMDGVTFEYYKSPVEIIDGGIILSSINVETQTSEGNISSSHDMKKEIYHCNSVIIAASQGPRTNMVAGTSGIDLGTEGLVMADQDGRTSRKGVFASGDVVTGAKTVVEAVRFSKRVSKAIEEYIEQTEI